MFHGGIPAWEIVGLPDTSVREAKERVRISIKNSGLEFPSRRIVVNLSPANTKKEGSSFDLAIAIGILYATEHIISKNISNFAFIGELSLDGKINKINGILPICIEAKRLGISEIIIPKGNEKEASIVKGIKILPAENLTNVLEHLNGIKEISPVTSFDFLNNNQTQNLDFSDVKGQENVKRALEIAAAGNHNCLLIGPPGSRKNNARRTYAKYITSSLIRRIFRNNKNT